MLTNEEFQSLTKKFDVRRFLGTTVANKVVAAMSSTEEVKNLELSEEELEVLMDEVSMPDSADGNVEVSMRKKLTDMMMKFRSVI